MKLFADILLAAAFALISLWPVSKIGKNEISLNEKRKLNEYKPLFSEHGLNYTYGRDFDLYLNDHFLGRNSLIQTKNYLFSLINRRFENDFIIAGKERFYFQRKNIQEIISWDGKDFSALERNLSRLKSFCDANKIDLYCCVVPFKELVYAEKLNGISFSRGKAEKMNEKLEEKSAFLYYAYGPLCEAKESALTFYKLDHHWTPYGAFQAYSQLLAKIGKRHSDIKEIGNETYSTSESVQKRLVGSAVSMLNLPSNFYRFAFPNDSYVKYNFKKEAREAVLKKVLERRNGCAEYNIGKVVNSKAPGKKLFLFGDSQTFNIMTFFFYSFGETFYCVKPLQMYMPIIENFMLEEKPDIAVAIISEANVGKISGWYNIANKPKR